LSKYWAVCVVNGSDVLAEAWALPKSIIGVVTTIEGLNKVTKKVTNIPQTSSLPAHLKAFIYIL
jgi:hypothetical protein